MYDVLIKGATLIDGISARSRRSDIASRAGKIVAIADEIDTERATETIDASGHIVAPGFIDPHSHSDYYLLIDNRARSRLRQGVTTEIGGNCGYSAAPIEGEALADRIDAYRKIYRLDLDWRSVGEYLDRLHARKAAIDFQPLIGYNTIRASAMGFQARAPNRKERDKIADMIATGLDEGAIGMSLGLAYPPALFADFNELARAMKIVADRGKICSAHIRSEGSELIESIEEFIALARVSGARAQISHLKTFGRSAWGKLDRVFDLIESARDEGIEIMADRYPYLAANTGLSAILPDWAKEGSRDEIVARLRDPIERARVKKAISDDTAKDETYWSSVMISALDKEANRELEGATLTEAAERLGATDPIEALFELLISENALGEAIYFMMSDENLDRIYQKEWVMLGSDSGALDIDGPLSTGRAHPRAFGSYPKFWSEYVRDRRIIDPVEAIRKMSTIPARRFGLRDRGELSVGKRADMVIFDPSAFKERADYRDSFHFAEGALATIVNGRVAYRAETGRRPM